ncbi:hypothetical protein PTNB73_10604 [Pyrenophora teres f. teres]|nr:hypothetical protein PTNB73_10604 [Pyrenophora teres f. teres]
MSKPSIECQYFEHVPEHSVAACRECRYAVWPDQIEGHLQKQHKYFEVQAPSQDGEGPEIVPVDGAAAWARVGEQMAKAWTDIEKRAQTTIQEGERDEVNPWLERTQWLPYLVGMERPDLLACIEEPVAEPDARQEQQAEPVEAAIWAAMDGLARFSQASIIDRIGVFIRLEAIRTEMHQTRFQPLQPYMDKDAIVKHTRPWQQMLMFFARTQKEHGWKSPKYRFTRRQREAWEVLIEQAKRSIEGDEEDEAEDMDEEREEAGRGDDGRHRRGDRESMTALLVCAFGGAGASRRTGGRGRSSTADIVGGDQDRSVYGRAEGTRDVRAEEDSGDETDNNLDDSAYESGPSQRRRPKGYHYNYNRGHVEWTNGDELLYKELHFSMAQFRGMVMGWLARAGDY